MAKRNEGKPARLRAKGGTRKKRVGAGPQEFVIENIQKRFGEQEVLKGVGFEVARGELLAVVGQSGCGKSVMLDIITGMLAPEEGRVMAADHNQPEAGLVDFLKLDDDGRAAIRRHWGEVFQRNALFTGTVLENIALWFRAHSDLDEKAIRERAEASLKAVDLDVGDVIDKPRDSLSGGMAKRVAIARAIAIEPAVIFYDEPTSGLDPVTSASIHELILNVHEGRRAEAEHQEGRSEVADADAAPRRTSLVITHDMELLRRLAPRILMLHEGAVAFEGTFEEFEKSDDANARRYLEAMPALHADVGRFAGRR